MRFIIFLIWIHFFIVKAQVISGSPSDDIDYSDQNPLLCYNKAENVMVIQTAMDKKTRLNINVKDNIIGIVHYMCPNSEIKFLVDEYRYLIFSKMCTNRIEKYYKFQKNANILWSGFIKGVLPVLNITLTYNKSIENNLVKFVIENCALPKNEMRMRDLEIDLRNTNRAVYTLDNFTFQYSIPFDLNTSPIKFSISETHSNKYVKFDNKMADINLFIQKKTIVPCTMDNKINVKFCSHLCQYNLRHLDEKCIMNIGNAKIELPDEPQYCEITVKSISRQPQKINGSICGYFKAKGYSQCKYFCVDLHNCSFMCVNKHNGEYNEIGYQEYFLRIWSPLRVGSGHWSYENIHIEKVFFNECVQPLKLCKYRLSCTDKDVAYKCLFNDDTGKCKDFMRSNRFWRCPVNDMRVPEFTNILDMILYENTTFTYKFEKLMKYYYIFFAKNKTASKTKRRIKYSYAALRFALKLLDDASDNMLDVSTTSYHSQENGEAYIAYVNKTAKEVKIPLSNKTNDDKNQFVKLIFKDTSSRQSSEKLKMKFIRFTDMDMMGESKEVKSKLNTYNLDTPDSTDIHNNNIFYKNSDMFTLTINENRSVAVQFKLKTIDSMTQSKTWLYQFEEKCAYLDDSSALNDKWIWSTKGCRKITTSNLSFCECDHLSNFAVIFSMKMINKFHLDIFYYMSIIGGIINIISLMLFLIFILFINSRDKLRLDLLNIALCLLFGTLIFLFGGLSVKNEILCKLAALTAQFLFLSAFVWKLIFGINAVRMVSSLRRRNEDWMVKYRIVALASCYCAPLLIVIVSGSLFWHFYGEVSDNVCWIETKTSAFLTFLIPIGIILAVNLIALFYIAATFIRNHMKTSKAKVNRSNELIIFFQLVVTMGITWLPSSLATIYISAMYLFVIFFPLQGMFMFLIGVLMHRENRRKVSSFITQRYSSLLSRSTISTDIKSNSKFRSSTQSQSTEQSQVLLPNSDNIQDKNLMSVVMPMMTITDQDESSISFQDPAC